MVATKQIVKFILPFKKACKVILKWFHDLDLLLNFCLLRGRTIWSTRLKFVSHCTENLFLHWLLKGICFTKRSEVLLLVFFFFWFCGGGVFFFFYGFGIIFKFLQPWTTSWYSSVPERKITFQLCLITLLSKMFTGYLVHSYCPVLAWSKTVWSYFDYGWQFFMLVMYPQLIQCLRYQ